MGNCWAHAGASYFRRWLLDMHGELPTLETLFPWIELEAPQPEEIAYNDGDLGLGALRSECRDLTCSQYENEEDHWRARAQHALLVALAMVNVPDRHTSHSLADEEKGFFHRFLINASPVIGKLMVIFRQDR